MTFHDTTTIPDALMPPGGLNIPDTMPVMSSDGGFLSLTLKENDRLSISTSIERLINMLDDLDCDPDLEDTGDIEVDDAGLEDGNDDEPTLGAAENHPEPGWGAKRSKEGAQGSWYVPSPVGEDEPSLGAPACAATSHDSPWGRSGYETRRAEGSQMQWSRGYDRGDSERELENEHGGDINDEPQGDPSDSEPELGWTEEINQVRRLEVAEGWFVDGGEPALGWAESHGRGIIGEQNCIDDREHDDERQPNGDEGDYSQSEDDVYPDNGGFTGTSGTSIGRQLVEKAKRIRNGDIVREYSTPTRLPPDAIPMLTASDFYRLPFADNEAHEPCGRDPDSLSLMRPGVAIVDPHGKWAHLTPIDTSRT